MSEHFSYKKAGVDIDAADATKQAMAKSLETHDTRVLNRLGAFASLVDGRFTGLEHPILVLKTEEPGSKQKLAFQYGYVSSICYDLINHLINDIIVMGAEPLYVQDCIICGRLEPTIVQTLVAGMADACRDQGCNLVGGETSEQPGVVEPGVYILSANIVGVVDKAAIIDGSRVVAGDIVLAVASNGLHTNGYSLVRALMQEKPDILQAQIDGERFLDVVMRPHTCYYQALRGLFSHPQLHGMAHITGGGIEGNLNRILPSTLDAAIDLANLRVPPIFKLLRSFGNLNDADMLRTFNMGAGLTIVVDALAVPAIIKHLAQYGCEAYPIGSITSGTGKVCYTGQLIC